MREAILYCRVSTTKQAEEGVSLDAQVSRARAWAEAMGYTIGGEYEDAGITGSRMDIRHGLQKALAHVTRTKGALIVYSLSRLARSTKDAITIAESLDKAGADLVSLSEQIDTTSAGGKMVFRMMAVLSEYERDLISERTKNALAHKKANGYRVSGEIPFGYDLTDGGRLTENPHEQEAISLISSLREKGYTLRAICGELTERGYETKTGAKWYPQTVSMILKRVA